MTLKFVGSGGDQEVGASDGMGEEARNNRLCF